MDFRSLDLLYLNLGSFELPKWNSRLPMGFIRLQHSILVGNVENTVEAQ